MARALMNILSGNAISSVSSGSVGVIVARRDSASALLRMPGLC